MFTLCSCEKLRLFPSYMLAVCLQALRVGVQVVYDVSISYGGLVFAASCILSSFSAFFNWIGILCVPLAASSVLYSVIFHVHSAVQNETTFECNMRKVMSRNKHLLSILNFLSLSLLCACSTQIYSNGLVLQLQCDDETSETCCKESIVCRFYFKSIKRATETRCCLLARLSVCFTIRHSLFFIKLKTMQ